MRERLIGGVATLLLVLAAFGLSHVPYGWAAAGVLAVLVGWGVGGYARRLRRQAERDPLTGMINRRAFDVQLQREWDRAHRYSRPLSLLFVEVDDFGQVNKRYGHLMGDNVLRAVGRELRESIRNTDILARWGGDEFVILLPETDRSPAALLAERIRATVERCLVQDMGRTISVTISTGVSGLPGTARKASDLLRQAIDAQRAAKLKKNAVSVV